LVALENRALVGQENQIEDVRFLFSPLTTPPLWAPKREYNAVSAERSMKFGNIVRVGTLRYLTKITALRKKADREGLAAKPYGFTTITTASLQFRWLAQPLPHGLFVGEILVFLLFRGKLAKHANHRMRQDAVCTVGGNQARLDARTEFKISQRSLKGVKLVMQ